jgi:hypothetical protein
MKRVLTTLCVALLAAGIATAMDVTLKDGTVIPAVNYRVTGSYVMIELADGRQVAYDVGDVDLEALRAAEAAAATQETAAGGEDSSDTLGSGRSLKHASTVGEDDSSGLKISDRDVRHVRGSGVVGDDEEEGGGGAAEAGVPAGFEEGGGVVLNNIGVTPAGEGRWLVEGVVVNRTPGPVMNVRVKLETASAGGGEPWRGEVPVTSYLGPDETATFSHGFAYRVAEGQSQPDVRVSVIWMKQETVRTPDYTKAGGVPHPSNLPLVHGGVGGADVRPTEIE